MLRVNLKKKQVVLRDSTLLATMAVIVLILVSLFLQVETVSKKTHTLHAISIEEKEAVFTIIEKMEHEPRLQAFANWLTETLKSDSSAILVSNQKAARAVELKTEGTLVFSQRFFSADPITQELALVKVLSEAGYYHSENNQNPPSELAILPH